MKRQLLRFGFILAIILFVFAGCKKDNSTPTSPGTASNDISIQGMAFNPAAKTVQQGTTLKWTNNDNVAHTVTSGTPGNANGTFNSGNIANGGSFSYTFNTVGTFSYFCSIHPSMTGTITVTGSNGSGGGGSGGGGGYTYP